MILAILQARMSSKRFPGKVLRPICGVPMLLFEYDRVKQSKMLDHIVIATSVDKTDDPIRDLCAGYRITCFSGSLDDVLDRFYWLAMLFRPHHIVRITGDCPLIDPEIIDQTVKVHLRGEFDYTHATTDCGWPDGYDTEVFTFNTLIRSWKEATAQHDREHVTPFIRNHSEIFRIGEYRNSTDQSAVKISVDTEEDFQRVERLVNAIQRI